MEWERRNTVDAHRAGELVELYESLGFEVKLERIGGAMSDRDECSVCMENEREEYFIIYTRKNPPDGG